MRLTLKSVIVAVVLGLCVAPATHAGSNVVFTMALSNTSADGTGGVWSVYEQNSNPSATSGLAGIQFNVIAAGGVSITSGTTKLPNGLDQDSGTVNGFVVFTSGGTISGGSLTGARGQQGSIYTKNPAGDVYSVYTGFGNVAEAIPTSDDGSGGTAGDQPGNITYKNIEFPALIARGFWSDPTGSVGTLTADAAPLQVSLLPAVMPSAEGGNIVTFTPDAVIPGTVTVPSLPEPALGGTLLGMGLLGLSRRKSRRAI